jgi:predicted DNA-binding transcriptional regulator AlpA
MNWRAEITGNPLPLSRPAHNWLKSWQKSIGHADFATVGGLYLLARVVRIRAPRKIAASPELCESDLPVYVRFRDISAAGIARNWPTLTRLIEEEGFPRGVMLSPNIRAWPLDEIKQWLATRPVERKPVPTRWGGDRRIATT